MSVDVLYSMGGRETEFKNLNVGGEVEHNSLRMSRVLRGKGPFDFGKEEFQEPGILEDNLWVYSLTFNVFATDFLKTCLIIFFPLTSNSR